MSDHPGGEQQVVYQIRVKGRLDGAWSAWLDGLEITPQPNGETLLSGPVADQTALHGILARIRDMNLILISVARMETDARP